MLNVENLIIGAGISGLTFAANCKEDYLIVEKESSVGGLCRTFYEGDFIWDFAGHFFHFASSEIKSFFESEISEDDMVKCLKCTDINYYNNIIDYPFQMNIHQLPKSEFIDCLYDLFNKEEEIQKLNYELNSLNDKLKKLQSQLTNSEADDKLNEEMGNILLEKELNEIHSLTTEIIDINSEKNTYLNQLENLFIETNILNKEKIELQQALYSIEDDFKNIIDGITNEINSVNNLGEPLTKEDIIKLLNYLHKYILKTIHLLYHKFYKMC